MHEVTVRRHFYATHQLRGYPADAEGPHRHRWEVHVTARTPEIAEVGFGLDFVAFDGWLKETLARFEGRLLNEIEPFDRVSPSAEHLAAWVWRQLQPRVAATGRAALSRVEVFEGPRFSAAYWEGIG